jgi:hypothetical protein
MLHDTNRIEYIDRRELFRSLLAATTIALIGIHPKAGRRNCQYL